MIEGLVPGGLDFSGLQVKEFDLVSEDQIVGVTAKVRCPEVPDDSQADYSRSPAATVSVVLNRNLKNVRDVPRFDLRLFSRLV